MRMWISGFHRSFRLPEVYVRCTRTYRLLRLAVSITSTSLDEAAVVAGL